MGDDEQCIKLGATVHVLTFTDLFPLYWLGTEQCLSVIAWGTWQDSNLCWTSDHRPCLCKSLYLD